MEKNRKLNIDSDRGISELTGLLKDFILKNKKYNIFFRGKSFDFESFRDYFSEDDASNIDWIASSRFDKLLIKQYREEEKLTVIFAIDTGENMILGSGKKLKCECAAELALALAYLIIENKDNRIGFILFNDKVRLFSPPMKGQRAFYNFSGALSEPKNYGGGSNLNDALEFLTSLPNYPLGCVILISDFLKFDGITRKKLSAVSSRYELIAFMIRDILDNQLPNFSGEFMVEDNTTGEQMLIDPSIARKKYESYAKEQENFVNASFRDNSIDNLKIMENEPYTEKVAEFLKDRLKIRGNLP